MFTRPEGEPLRAANFNYYWRRAWKAPEVPRCSRITARLSGSAVHASLAHYDDVITDTVFEPKLATYRVSVLAYTPNP